MPLNPPTIKPQICGLHENGACRIEPLGPRYLISSPKIHRYGNFDLMPHYAEQFAYAPSPIEVTWNIKIQRIVNSKKTNVMGSWWKLDHHLPTDRRDWRDKYAVLILWNDNSWYTDVLLKPHIPIWCGRAASQKVLWDDDNKINENCILRGAHGKFLSILFQ